MKPTITRSVDLAAGAADVWAIITDLPGMGELSPENAGGRRRDGHSPAMGAVFDGVNRNGGREWRTVVHVVACDPDRLFAFEVRTPFGLTTSRWSYELTALPAGCRLTESWFRFGNLVMRRFVGPLVAGRWNRPACTAHSMEHTLVAIVAIVARVGRVGRVGRVEEQRR